jgi:toxin ParE1/3/4
MTIVIFHPFAEQELLEAAAYYEELDKGLGLEYLNEVQNLINFLIRYPEAGQVVQNSIRRIILPKFPYSLIYRLIENGQIRILAIAHHKRKPNYWQNRE